MLVQRREFAKMMEYTKIMAMQRGRR